MVTLIIFSFQTISCNLIEFPVPRTVQKINLSHTLGLIFFKSPSLNPTHSLKAFQQYQEHTQIPL